MQIQIVILKMEFVLITLEVQSTKFSAGFVLLNYCNTATGLSFQLMFWSKIQLLFDCYELDKNSRKLIATRSKLKILYITQIYYFIKMSEFISTWNCRFL